MQSLAGTVGAMVGGSLPKVKIYVDASYQRQSLTFTAQWRYVDSMRDVHEVPEYTIDGRYDLDPCFAREFGTDLLDGRTLSCGVEDEVDKNSPLIPSSVWANTDPSHNDVPGRRYCLNPGYRF